MKASSFPRLTREWKGWARWSRGPAGLRTSSSTWGGRRASLVGRKLEAGAGGWQNLAMLTPNSLKVCRELRTRLLFGYSGGREIPEGAPASHLAGSHSLALRTGGGGDADPKAGGTPRLSPTPTHQNCPPQPGIAAVPPRKLPLGLRGEKVGVKSHRPQLPGGYSPSPVSVQSQDGKGALAAPQFRQKPSQGGLVWLEKRLPTPGGGPTGLGPAESVQKSHGSGVGPQHGAQEPAEEEEEARRALRLAELQAGEAGVWRDHPHPATKAAGAHRGTPRVP